MYAVRKHKNKPISALPHSYVLWLWNNVDLARWGIESAVKDALGWSSCVLIARMAVNRFGGKRLRTFPNTNCGSDAKGDIYADGIDEFYGRLSNVLEG